jgi:hypothetical protein
VTTPQRIGTLPLPFASAVHDLNCFDWDSRIEVSELEPPCQIAPYAAAIDAEITSQGEDLATGRLILLHDPQGNDLWQGDFRCVTFAQSEVSVEMIHDPFLADVGWSWLMDALKSSGAQFLAESGTITTTNSTPFGSKESEEQLCEIEIRASWTPVLDNSDPFTPHLKAWQALLCQVAGIPLNEAAIPLVARNGSR